VGDPFLLRLDVMELLAGVLEFVAFLVATRRGLFWLPMGFIIIGTIAAFANTIEPRRN
jgi:hypothetical protein